MSLAGAIICLVVGLVLIFATVGILHLLGIILAIVGVIGLVLVLLAGRGTRV